MSAQDLYYRWSQAMADEGVEVDTWDHLPASDRAAWQNLADELAELGLRPAQS